MNCIIIDDDSVSRKISADFSEEIPDLELLNEFGKIEEAIPFLNANPVDLIFLDVELPGLS